MSLSAALKAGLGQNKSTDAASSDAGGWDPYPETRGSAAKPARAKAPTSSPAPSAAPNPTPSARPGSSRQMVPAGNAGAEFLKPKPKAPAPANVNQRPKQQVNARAVARPSTGRKAPAQGQAQVRTQAAKPAAERRRTDWLSEPDAVPASRVNPQQFLREFERFIGDQNASAARDAVLDVSAREIEGVARMAAKVRGRYLAKLIDTGDPDKSSLQEAEVRELARYREMHTELMEGVELLKQAIASGDIAVKGMLGR